MLRVVVKKVARGCELVRGKSSLAVTPNRRTGFTVHAFQFLFRISGPFLFAIKLTLKQVTFDHPATNLSLKQMKSN